MLTIRQTIIDDETVDLIFTVARNLPDKIYDEQIKYNALANDHSLSLAIADAKQELAEIRGIFLFVVTTEMTKPPEGLDEKALARFKPKAVFPNAESRVLETDRRCKEDLDYQAALARFRDAESKSFARKTELEDQAALIKRLSSSLSIRTSIINAVAGLAQEDVSSARLKAIAKVQKVIAEIQGETNDEN